MSYKYFKIGMKPKVVVEQLESYEDIWDNNILQLPTILSSPCKWLKNLVICHDILLLSLIKLTKIIFT